MGLSRHDEDTFPKFAYERVLVGLPMLGVFVISDDIPIGLAIEEIVIVMECSEPHEWRDQVQFLPL